MVKGGGGEGFRSVLQAKHGNDLFGDLGITFRRPFSKYGAPDSHLAASHCDGALKVLAHPHAQLQPVCVQAQLPANQVPLFRQGDKVLVLVLRCRGLAPRDCPDGHETQESQVRTRFDDAATKRDRVLARRAARLGFLPGRVDLHVDGEFGQRRFRGEEIGARGVEESGFFEAIYGGYAEEVGDLGECLAVTWVLCACQSRRRLSGIVEDEVSRGAVLGQEEEERRTVPDCRPPMKCHFILLGSNCAFCDSSWA